MLYRFASWASTLESNKPKPVAAVRAAEPVTLIKSRREIVEYLFTSLIQKLEVFRLYPENEYVANDTGQILHGVRRYQLGYGCSWPFTVSRFEKKEG